MAVIHILEKLDSFHYVVVADSMDLSFNQFDVVDFKS